VSRAEERGGPTLTPRCYLIAQGDEGPALIGAVERAQRFLNQGEAACAHGARGHDASP
jgi:hypothetical protein